MYKNRKSGQFIDFFLVHFVPGHLLLPLSRDKGTAGQAKLFCPRTKGQRDKLKILPRDRTGQDSKIWNGTRLKMGQSRKGCSKTGKLLKQKMLF